MMDTYSLEHMCTYPYQEDFGIDGPDGNALWGQDAEDMWRMLYYAVSNCMMLCVNTNLCVCVQWSDDSVSSSDEEKPPKGGDKWCKKMINIYSLTCLLYTSPSPRD